NIERFDGADAKTGERRFVENTPKEIENVGARGEIAAPGAQVDAAQDDFPKARIRETRDFGKDRFGRKATALTSDKRDDAEGTTIDAAVLNLEGGAGVIPFPAEDWGDEDFLGSKDISYKGGRGLCRWVSSS